MNLTNYLININQVIIDRGYDYYVSGFVSSTEFYDGAYHFRVVGSDVYKVVVTLDDDGEIISSDCNCPYTCGPVCKHEVAAYLELSAKEPNELSEIKKEHQGFRQMLAQLPQRKLVEIVMDMSKNHPVLKNRLMLQYSREVTGFEVVYFKEIIRAIVSDYTRQGSYITYREVSRFATELGDCLVQVETCDDPMTGLQLAFLLLEEAMEAFQYADDSDGDISRLVSDTFRNH